MQFRFIPLLAALSAVRAVQNQQLDATSTESYCPPRPATPEEQQRLAEEFATGLYGPATGEELAAIYARHVDVDYIQHNPYGLSGRDASFGAVNDLKLAGATFELPVFRTAFQNDLAWIHLRAHNLLGAVRPSAVVDILRMNGTCVMEHWDVIQEVPADAINPLPMW